jgi:hypothetical protein
MQSYPDDSQTVSLPAEKWNFSPKQLLSSSIGDNRLGNAKNGLSIR